MTKFIHTSPFGQSNGVFETKKVEKVAENRVAKGWRIQVTTSTVDDKLIIVMKKHEKTSKEETLVLIEQ